MMRGALSVGVVVSFALGTVIACGGSSSSGGGGGAGSADIGSFAQSYCALFEPCCADAGLPSNGQQCAAVVVALGGASGTYNATAGSACLGALQQQSSQSGFCTSGGNAPQCQNVFSGNSGTAPPGGQCTKSSDCASSTDGKVSCYDNVQFVDGGSAETRTCLLEKPGKAGDSPCIASVTESNGGTLTSYNFQGPAPAEGFVCDSMNGLYCDATSKACATLGNVGDACASSQACKADTYCDFSSKTCKARPQAGQSCSGGTPCASGLTCDPSSQTCVQGLANGATCTTSQQCASQECVNGKCGSGGSLSLEIVCGGH